MRRVITVVLVAATMLELAAGRNGGAGPFAGLAGHAPPVASAAAPAFQEYPVPRGSHPHDVAPAPSGAVWYTAQTAAELGQLDPKTGQIRPLESAQTRRAPWPAVGGCSTETEPVAASMRPT